MALLPSSTPSSCFQCGGGISRCITSYNNPNGNAGRPYSKCLSCHKFLGFDDERGNHSSNPECHCGVPSKMQLTGRGKGYMRLMHLVCRVGGCNFFSREAGKDGSVVYVSPDMIGTLVEARFI